MRPPAPTRAPDPGLRPPTRAPDPASGPDSGLRAPGPRVPRQWRGTVSRQAAGSTVHVLVRTGPVMAQSAR